MSDSPPLPNQPVSRSRGSSLCESSPSLCLHALAQPVTRAVNQYPQMSDADLQIITDFFCVQAFHFAQQENLPLLHRDRSQATIHCGPNFLGCEQPFQIFRMADPVALPVKPIGKRWFNRIAQFLALQSP